MSILRNTFLMLCTSALTGCLFIQQEDIEEPQACPAIYELCPEGSTAVEECAQGARCVQINECGGDPTICQYNEGPITCDAYPVCPEGAVEVPSCDLDDPSCSQASICGQTIYCEERIANCAAYPSCPEGTYQIEGDACPPDASCTSVSLCGATILCAKGGINNCEAYPSCDADEQQVMDCADNGIPCRYVELCGYTIACQKDLIQCAAVPVCEEGYRQVPDCADNGRACEYVTVCGSTIACEEERIANCQAFPTCPAGSQQVMGCDPNDPTCSQVTLCGHTISCQSGASSCAPQRVSGDGLCDAFFGYGWNGQSCEGVSGCRCTGADCGDLYMSQEQCESAYAFCAP